MDEVLAGRVKGPDGSTTSFELSALPEKLRLTSIGSTLVTSARTVNVIVVPLGTWAADGTMLSFGPDSVPTSPEVWMAALIAVTGRFADVRVAGAPICNPAVVW